ncbi:MAG: hypothetical protein LBJ32_01575, partial [Oscillospiraceae bacterium]|nr:hypothetical protein [Oscillospiraceae bacterium]
RLIKEKENQEAAERLRKLKEDQEAEEARHLIKENQEEKLQILSEIKEWFEGLDAQDEIRKKLMRHDDVSNEYKQNFISFFIKAVFLAEELLKALKKRLNFERYENFKEIIVENTGAVLDLNCSKLSELNPLNKCNDKFKTVEDALGIGFNIVFICFATILNVLVKTFNERSFGRGDNMSFLKRGFENINGKDVPVLITTEYNFIDGKLMPTFSTIEFKHIFLDSSSIVGCDTVCVDSYTMINSFKYVLETINEETTFDRLARLREVLNLQINNNNIDINILNFHLVGPYDKRYVYHNY